MTRHYNRVPDLRLGGQKEEAKAKLLFKNELHRDGHAGTISMCKGPIVGK